MSPSELGAAFQALAPALFSWARLMLPARLKGVLDAEDLIQEVWLRLLNLRPDCRGEAAFRSYAFEVARRVGLEAMKHAGRRVTGPPAGSSERLGLVDALADLGSTVSQRLARDDALQSFLATVSAWSKADADLLVYRALEGLSAAECGGRLGLSEAAVHKRWSRLRSRLADHPALLQLRGFPPA